MEYREKITELHTDGKTITEIANAIGISYSYVYRIHQLCQLKPNKKEIPLHQKIVQMAIEHPELSYQEIGRIMNCTRQNVSFTCLKHNVSRKTKNKQ